MAYITCKDLTVGYNKNAVASGLNFTVNKGDYICVVGTNGAGKSTLMRTLLNLQSPVAGEIITGDGLKSFEIGYLPQRTDTQKDFPASVKEVVLSGTQAGSRRLFYSREQKERAFKNIKELGIWDLRNRSFRSLSGGQQQRTLLARALSGTDKILLLDEPITGLDPSAASQLYEITDRLNRNGVAIIMITHDLAAVEHADHILHVDKNHNFFGTKIEYMNSEKWKLFQEIEEMDRDGAAG